MDCEKRKNNSTGYYVGLDIGTDSVGYAVTDSAYRLCKHKGEPVWGVHTFEVANQSAERRQHRTDRRRLDRRQWRIHLLSEIFAPDMAQVDERFFIRLKESALYREDVRDRADRHIFFNDEGYNDSNYFKEYPTIHHLIRELMDNQTSHDIRLVYLACAWLIAHRGHFLSEISKENTEAVTDFGLVYDRFIHFFKENDYNEPWELRDADEILAILKQKTGVSAKEKAVAALLFDGKMPKDKNIFGEEELEKNPFDRAMMIKLLCGGSVKPDNLFLQKGEDYSEIKSVSLGMSDEDFNAVLGELGDDGAIIIKLKEVYDAAVLNSLLGNQQYISEAKVAIYEQHAEDLKNLKKYIKKYVPKQYDEVFRKAGKNVCNYVAYSYNVKSIKDKASISELKKCSKEDFCKYIKSIVKTIVPFEEDRPYFDDLLQRLDACTFMPKQVDSDNRVIPYQLYWVELKKILENAKGYLPFLSAVDEDGMSAEDKILSIFEFRVPYFVGPLHKDASAKGNAWLERKASGKLLPWNIEDKIDYDRSEQEFINRLINQCTYLPAENVLPKDSLLYSKFCVLNEISNIKIDEREISVELKQKIFTEVFMKNSRVTAKKIRDFCISDGAMSKTSDLGGIDHTIRSSLKSYFDFRRLMGQGVLDETDVEAIIERSAYSDNKSRFKKWLCKNYPQISAEDVAYIASKKYKDFGRLSRKFLCDFYGAALQGTGEAFTIIEGLWNTNNNLMQLLSDQYTFAGSIEEEKNMAYGFEQMSLSERLDSMYISNAVKRPIIRTLEVISDVCKAMGNAPSKIFIEMARGATEDQKGKRTKTRKEKIYDLYNRIKDEDLAELCGAMRSDLEAMGDSIDNRLQSEKLYLYYLQLGKCMYSGDAINLDQLMNDKIYDVDHIYPQSLVKDDSVLNNKVLVLSKLNAEKEDNYPIDPDIRRKMGGFWKALLDNQMIEPEKYKRLTRNHAFSDEEKMGFINRQLVETRQSTKAVATLLKEKFPQCEIVYVKAGLVSDFRKQYDMLKSRKVNDLHHAKDAYLNIVVGNVYDTKFSKKWFKLSDNYSMKPEKIFKYPVKTQDGEIVWTGNENMSLIKKQYLKNHVHITRYAFCRKGGLFDQMPLKAAAGLVPRKKDLPPEKYGGYNKPTASFFALVKFTAKKKSDIMLMPVELMYAEQYKQDREFAAEYAKKTISDILEKEVYEISFPLEDRMIRVNTIFEFDGMRMCLAGKSGGGRQILITNMMPFLCDCNTEQYIRRLEKHGEKIKENPRIKEDARFDKITAEENAALYELYIEKLTGWPYNKRPANPVETLIRGREKFKALSIKDQVRCLLNIQELFGRLSGGTDLTYIGGVSKAGATTMSSLLSNWTKTYREVRIIDLSPSGLFEKKTENLLELL